MARRRFNMVRYAADLDALGAAAAVRRQQRETQVETLLPDDAFEPDLYFSSGQAATLSREEAVRRYLEDTLNADFSGPAVWGHHPRRALPGFHALMYGRLAPHFDRERGVDPLVDFVSKGRPAGPWTHPVIRLQTGDRASAPRTARLRVAVHGHFHYTENFPDFLDALEINEHPMDLLLTTTGEGQAELLRRMSAERYTGGRVSVVIGPNMGRDVGPFLSLLQDRLADYDVVGHLHGKRSVHTLHYDPELGNRWRHFLWQHLIGPAAAAADIILERFADEADLGLVFPENDFLVGWEKNRDLAEAMAPRLGLAALPEHIEFPVGTMFWARPAALKLLAEARLRACGLPARAAPDRRHHAACAGTSDPPGRRGGRLSLHDDLLPRIHPLSPWSAPSSLADPALSAVI